MSIQDRVTFWIPTEWAHHDVDHMLYADLVVEASQAGLLYDLRQFPAFFKWKSDVDDSSGQVEVGRMEDGTPVINYTYEVSGGFFAGFFRNLADNLKHLEEAIGFADMDNVLLLDNLFGNPEAEFLSVSGWVKTTEEIFQAAEEMQGRLLARLEEDGSAGAVEHLTDQASTPKAV